jgi:tetratricopeptide (TPR) repeat protein
MMVGVVACCAFVSRADYPGDRAAAMELVKAGNDPAALTAFLKMADVATSEAQKGDAFEQAALCANRLKQVDQAVALTGKIPQAPLSKAVRMKLLLENGRGAELIAAFKDEALGGWPENAAGRAFYYRGRAHSDLKNGQAAEADLRKALENLGEGDERDVARLTLARNYRDVLKDDRQALAAFLECIDKAQYRYGWISLEAITAAADLLRKQGRSDDTLKVLGRVNVKTMTGDWKSTLLQAYAETYAAQGKKADALALMKEARAVPGIQEWRIAACENALKAMQSP